MSARQARDHPAGSPKHLFGLPPATASSGSVLRDALQGDGYFASSVRALVDLVDGWTRSKACRRTRG